MLRLGCIFQHSCGSWLFCPPPDPAQEKAPQETGPSLGNCAGAAQTDYDRWVHFFGCAAATTSPKKNPARGGLLEDFAGKLFAGAPSILERVVERLRKAVR